MKERILRFAVLVVLGIIPAITYAQQDPQYSLYMFDKMAVNPAAAGSKDALEATLITRDQWLDIGGHPITNALMVEAPMASKKVGWGFEVMDDQIGPENSIMLQGNYAYQLKLGNGKLAMGIGLGIYDYTIDWSMVDFKDKNDVYAMQSSTHMFTPTAEAGLYYYNSSWYAGISFNHLIQGRLTSITTDSSAAFRPHSYFIAGKAFKLSDNVILNPSVVFLFAQNSPSTGSLNINMLFSQKLWVGFSIRQDYGVTLLAAYKASSLLQIGYAYDAGTAGINKLGGGSHELSLTFDFATRKAVQMSPRYF